MNLEYVSICKEVEADIFVIGEDWGNKQHNLDVEAYLKSKGKQIIQVRYSPQTSSTKIKQDVIAQIYTGKYLSQTIEPHNQNISAA